MRKLALSACCALLAATVPAVAQSGNPMTDAMKAQFAIVKGDLTKTAEQVTEENYAFKPTPDGSEPRRAHRPRRRRELLLLLDRQRRRQPDEGDERREDEDLEGRPAEVAGRRAGVLRRAARTP